MLHPPLVLRLIVLEEPGRLAVGRRSRVRVAQQRPDRSQDGPHVVDWAPLIHQNVQAYSAVVVNVGVEYLGLERYLWRFGGVGFGELQLQLENSAFPGGLLGPLDDGVPQEQVLLIGSGVDAAVLLFLDFLEVLEQPASGWACHILF